jgi:hypothetical protein
MQNSGLFFVLSSFPINVIMSLINKVLPCCYCKNNLSLAGMPKYDWLSCDQRHNLQYVHGAAAGD